MDGISFPSQEALACPLSEVHTGLATVHVNQEQHTLMREDKVVSYLHFKC